MMTCENMKIIIVSSCKNPVRVGTVVVFPQVPILVDTKELSVFKKTKMGKFLYDQFFSTPKKPKKKKERKVDANRDPVTTVSDKIS